MSIQAANAARWLPLVLALGLWGCGGGGETTISSSGDPEADRRADLRVGTSTDRSGGDKGTLYERLGGREGIIKIVDEMTERTLADPRVNFDRKKVSGSWMPGRYKGWDQTPENVEAFKGHMVEFLSLAAGGPARYSGREMREIHKGMAITNSEFDAMIGDAKISMERLGVATREMRDVIAILETTRKQVVEKR